MIRQVTFNNFKALQQVEIPLERFTLIVGPNASGKSSILQGLDLFRLVVDREPLQVLSGDLSPYYLATKNSTDGFNIEIQLDVMGAERTARLSARQAAEESNIRWECLVSHKGAGFTAKTSDAVGGRWKDLGMVLAAGVFLALDASLLSKPSTGSIPLKVFAPDGSKLPHWLATMRALSLESCEILKQSVEKVVQQINDFELEQTTVSISPEGYSDNLLRPKLEFDALRLILKHKTLGAIPAMLASEGTLLTFALLSLVCSPHRPRTILLDNFERGLHPRAMKELVSQIRKLLEMFPDLQIIATSHSPYLVDLFDPPEIRLLTLDEHGHAVCGTLTDHPDFQRWKDEMLPGEFWSMVGEDWLRNPAKAKA